MITQKHKWRSNNDDVSPKRVVVTQISNHRRCKERVPVEVHKKNQSKVKKFLALLIIAIKKILKTPFSWTTRQQFDGFNRLNSQTTERSNSHSVNSWLGNRKKANIHGYEPF